MSVNTTYQKTYDDVDQIDILVNGKLAEVNTIVPCTVVSVESPKVTIRPLIKRIYFNSNQDVEYIDYGDIPNIPVLNFGNATVGITFPDPLPGDTGLLLVNQNFVGSTYNSGEKISPRKFSLLDGVYLPFRLNNSTPPAGTLDIKATELKATLTTLDIETDTFKIENTSTEFVKELVEALKQIATSNCVNGAPLTNAAAIAASAALIETFEA